MPFLRGCPRFILHQSQLLMVVGECRHAWTTSIEADRIMTGAMALVHHALYLLSSLGRHTTWTYLVIFLSSPFIDDALLASHTLPTPRLLYVFLFGLANRI
jgi:hypothetical protein